MEPPVMPLLNLSLALGLQPQPPAQLSPRALISSPRSPRSTSASPRGSASQSPRVPWVPGGKQINLRWRLPNNGAFAAAPQPADHLADYLAGHASEATEAKERGAEQLQLHGRGADLEAALQGEGTGSERARADRLELELERANARNQELQLRIDTLVREIGVARDDQAAEPHAPPELRGDALAEEHRTLQEHLVAVTAQLEGVQANAATLHGRLVHKEAELLAAQGEAAAQRRRVAETEEVLTLILTLSLALALALTLTLAETKEVLLASSNPSPNLTRCCARPRAAAARSRRGATSSTSSSRARRATPPSGNANPSDGARRRPACSRR